MSMIGKTLGSFTLEAQIGKGGMGEVYKAKDQKLGRDVAIKVLPEEFAKDADRVARFQREAKLLASLNHPNIASIYGLEESDGTHFLVLELIEGDTLADRLKHEAISVEESLKLALQIAEALEAAHEKGVIHRDLKPANIKVTPDGKVKVLDFGLAKAFAGEQADLNLSNSPTLSVAATQQGVILGTAAYMSPEQARGKEVDKRADIWAFGVVLFEMLTRKQVFTGDTVSDTLASVLAREPEWQSLPPNLHPRIRLLFERCLKKEPTNRYRDIGDARVDIQEVLADPDGVFRRQDSVVVESRGTLRTFLPWIFAVIGIIVAGVIIWKIRAPEPHQIVRFNYELAENQQFVNLWHPILAVSPDGGKLVYSTSEGLYLRSMESMEASLISGTDENSFHPFFSPNGQWVGYLSGSEGQLKKVPVGGGVPVTLCNDTDSARPRWNIDNTIVFGDSEGIMKVSADGGIPEIIFAREGEELYAPQILPDGESVLFTMYDGSNNMIAVQSLKSGKRKILTAGVDATYLPTGHLVYGLGHNLVVAPFDLDALELKGGRFPLVEGILWMGASSAPQYAISDSGTLVFVKGGDVQTESRILARVDRNGKRTPLNAPARAYVSPRVSPDGTKLVVQSIDADSEGTLWIYDLTDDRAIQRLTLEGNNYRPIWHPDGKWITFSSDRDGATSIYWMPIDRSAEAERLTTAEDETSHWAESWTPDGKTLAFTVERDLYDDWDIYLVSPGGEAECLYDSPETVYMNAQFSPDGQWIAYSISGIVGDLAVFVESFPKTGTPWQITEEGKGQGNYPVWSPDGRELFYRPTTYSGQKIALKVVDIITDPEFSFRNERTLPIEGFSSVSYYRGYDIIPPDGAEFVMTFPADPAKSSKGVNRRINVVLNWFEELKERVPLK